MSDLSSSAKRRDKTSSIITCQIDLYPAKTQKGFDGDLDIDETDEGAGIGEEKGIWQLDFKARLSNASNNSWSSGVKRTEIINSTFSKSSGKSDEL